MRNIWHLVKHRLSYSSRILELTSYFYWNWDRCCHRSEGSFITLFLAVRDVIEDLRYGQTIMLQQADSLCPAHAGLMVWSLWPIYFVCNTGKLDSLFPDDSFIDMGEIDVGRKVAQQIPPGIFWRSQVYIDHPMYLKFNVSLSKDALVGIYGRRGQPPTHTQVGRLNSYIIHDSHHFLWNRNEICNINICVSFMVLCYQDFVFSFHLWQVVNLELCHII